MSDGKGNGGAVDEKPDAAASEEAGLAPVETPVTREALAALEKECQELKDQLLRRRADFENFKKRVERDRQQFGQDAKAAVFVELIPILDNLDRALGAAAPEGSLREGVELIRRQMLTMLESSGVTIEDPSGARFDPERQQALSHEEAPGVPDGTVIEVLQKAYFLGDRLLRPALVKVAKGTSPTEPEPEEAVH